MRRPARRRVATAAVIAAAVLALLAPGAVPALAFDRQANETTMLRLINHVRADHGLHALRSSGPLAAAARAHSVDMIRHDYFAHSSLGGSGVGTRVRRAGYRTSGCVAWTVGEVIGCGGGARGAPRAVLAAWMRSSAHRGIILGRRWRDVGIGCAAGTFEGVSGVAMYTVDVGRRVR